MPEIPSIAHFCSLFKVALDLVDVEIDQLEAALLKQNNDQDTTKHRETPFQSVVSYEIWLA